MSLSDPLRRLGRDAAPRRELHAARAADADHVSVRLGQMADHFTSNDQARPLTQLLAGSAAEHFAWALRSDPTSADLSAILHLRGHCPLPGIDHAPL